MTTVYVAVYEHKHGNDVMVFATEANAYAWKDQIASDWWTSEFDEPVPVDNIGEAYFDRIEDEWFGIRECEVQP